MRYQALAVLVLSLVGASANSQTVKLPAALSGEPGVPIPVIADADGANVVWLTPDRGVTVIDGNFFGGDSKRAIVFGPTPGTYRLWAITAKGDRVSPLAECVVTIAGERPPPGPGPGPGPMPPDPPQPPAPILAQGLHVLVVYETADLPRMPREQHSVLFSQTVRDYLNQKCPVGPDGRTRQWRMWDKDTDGTADSKLWADAMGRKRNSIPWVIVSNGKTGYEGPLPANVDAMMELLRKYGE